MLLLPFSWHQKAALSGSKLVLLGQTGVVTGAGWGQLCGLVVRGCLGKDWI